RGAIGRRCRGVAGRRRAGGGEPGIGGRRLLLLERCLLLLLLQLRPGDEELPSQQHHHAEHDGYDHVAVGLVHSVWVPAARGAACTFAMAEDRSETTCENGKVRASRRPTST